MVYERDAKISIDWYLNRRPKILENVCQVSYPSHHHHQASLLMYCFCTIHIEVLMSPPSGLISDAVSRSNPKYSVEVAWDRQACKHVHIKILFYII